MHAAPSAPSDTEMPRARISATGARPDPSFRFELGQCSTFTSRSASSACSRLGDPDTMRGAEVRRREPGVGQIFEVGQAARQAPDDFDLVAVLRRMGVDDHADRASRGRRPLRAARASRTRRSAGRTPRAAGRWPRRPSACAARRSRRSTSASPLLQPRRAPAGRSPSCTCRRRRAGRISASVSKTTSVSCTVSIVSAVVVPVRSELGQRRGGRRAQRLRACAPLPSARRGGAATRAAACRRRSRGTASGRDGRGSG